MPTPSSCKKATAGYQGKINVSWVQEMKNIDRQVVVRLEARMLGANMLGDSRLGIRLGNRVVEEVLSPPR